MQYKLIRDDKETKDKEFVLVRITSTLLPIGFIMVFLYNTLPLYLLLIITIAFIHFIPKLVRTLYPDWVRKDDIIGFIEFETEKIYSNNNFKEIQVDSISRIQLNFNYIKGKTYNPRDIIHNGLAELFIDFNDGSKKRIVFLIESKKQLEYLSLILKEYYRKRIEIKEFFCQNMVKTILLKPNWKYKELQDLKQELNNDKI